VQVKLSHETANSNSQLRRVIAHANLMNTLLEELAIAEREQATLHEVSGAFEELDGDDGAIEDVDSNADSDSSEDSDLDGELNEEYYGMDEDDLGG
jgi:hypothetical protein